MLRWMALGATILGLGGGCVPDCDDPNLVHIGDGQCGTPGGNGQPSQPTQPSDTDAPTDPGDTDAPTDPSDTDPHDTDTDTDAADTDVHTGDTDPQVCDGQPQVIGSFPEPGTMDVYRFTELEVFFDAGLPDGDITVTVTAAGNAHPGTVASYANGEVVFTPSLPYPALSTIQMNVDWDCGSYAAVVTSSDVGGAVDFEDLAPVVFEVDLSTARVISPAALNQSVLANFVTLDARGLLGITDASADEARVVFARADGVGAQDHTQPTLAFDAEVGVDRLLMSGVAIPVRASGVDVVASGVQMSAAVAQDGSRFIDGRGSFTLDLREFADTTGLDVDDVCDALAAEDVFCQGCGGDAAQPYCLSIAFDDLRGTAVARNVEEVMPSEAAEPAVGCACGVGGGGAPLGWAGILLGLYAAGRRPRAGARSAR